MTNKKFLDYDGLVYFYSLLKNQFAPISGSGTYLTQTSFNTDNPDLAAIEALSGSGILTRSNADNSWSLDTREYIYKNAVQSGLSLQCGGTNLGNGYILPYPSNNQTQFIVTDQTVPKAATGGSGGGTPQMDGTVAVGTSTDYARADHVHPTDTTRQPLIDSSHKLSADLLEDGTTNHVFTAADDTKLTGIATGAEVNQNAFSNVKVGSSTIEAESKTDTLELAAGANISLTPDTTNDKVTIAVTGIASGAEVNQNAFSNVKVGESTIAADSKTDTLELAAGTNITLTPDTTNDKVTIATSAEVNQNAFTTMKIRTGQSSYTDIVADAKEDTFEIVAGSNVTLTADATNDKLTIASTDTKNTVGATRDTAKLELVGVKTSTNATQSYISTSDKAYVTDGYLYSNGFQVVNLGDAQTITGKKTFSTIPELSASPSASDSSHKVADTSWVNDAISTAIGGVTQISYSIVNSLPNSGSVGVIYLVAKNGTDSSDGYDEYIWLTGSSRFELIGHKVLDLTEYWNTTNLVRLTNTDISEIVNGVYAATPGLTDSAQIKNLMQLYLNQYNSANATSYYIDSNLKLVYANTYAALLHPSTETPNSTYNQIYYRGNDGVVGIQLDYSGSESDFLNIIE